MAQNKKTVSKFEFNKRIRDLLSRDRHRLRETFEKFDREHANRLAEINSMQEKVRHSMRNLVKERVKAQLRADAEHNQTRKESETEESPFLNEKFSIPELNDSRIAFTPEARRKSYQKALLPSIPVSRSEHLQVPNSPDARIRRHSVPHRPTFLPESPKDIRKLPKAYLSSSPPKEGLKGGFLIETPLMSNLALSSPKQRSRGINLQHNKNGYRLSIHDFPTSVSRSDNLLNTQVKSSPQFHRRPVREQNSHGAKYKDSHSETSADRKMECTKGVKSKEQEDSGENTTGSGHSNHSTVAMETESEITPDINKDKPKSFVKRSRSASLPTDPALNEI